MSAETKAARCGGQTKVTEVLTALNSTLPCKPNYPYGNPKLAPVVDRLKNNKLIKFDEIFGRWLRCS